ncbi:MAG: UDP-N-acetylglucosamine 2-epimerase (non-hydrolyzing) [Parachlamydiales bacterium]|nr:UDP-N-acetylglucosamine 2-epimerase (non-hydrolyzing) [Parachlamydiales bacterium]
MKILSVFGTRPETIKMAPIIERLKHTRGVESIVCVTAQHRHMLDQFMNLFGIQSDFDLNIMKPNQTLTEITTSILTQLKEVLRQVKPDLLLVQGDTTTAMAGALAAFYEHIPVGHVEAGLRTGNMMMPWPEEMNRKLIGSIATLHFAPTETAKNHLLRENIPTDKIFVTGNTVIDALHFTLKNSKSPAFDFIDPTKRLILVTGHRRENFGEGFQSICKALKKLSERKDVQIVYPVHLNPNVQAPVRFILGEAKNVHLMEPVDYFTFVFLMEKAHLILTDSGGVQEEAPSLAKPVLVMREVTERPEGIAAGTARLVGTDETKIIREAELLLDDSEQYKIMAHAHNPYGDGHAAERIVQHILEHHEASV